MEWADRPSQEIYEKCMNFIEPDTDGQQHYLPNNLPPYDKPLRFIDCGAYTGDTIKLLSQIEKQVEYVISFEPHPVFVKELKKTAATMPFPVTIYNKGVYDENIKKVPFDPNQYDASRIVDKSDTYIECVKLDDIILDLKPNFIKMDIEGAEYKALIGAKKTIKIHKPRLAICLYHYLNDIIDMPLLIDSWDLGYKFYLRYPNKGGLRLYATQ